MGTTKHPERCNHIPKPYKYFPWYPADAETDANYCAMTLEELGMYHKCLNLAWINGGLPTDKEDLSRLLRLPLKRFEKLWNRVSPCFELGQDGLLINRRQERERTQSMEISRHKSEAGKRGNQKRWSNRSVIAELSHSDPTGIARAYDSDSSSYVVTTGSKQTAESPQDFDVWAEGIYARWKKYRDKALALQALCDLNGSIAVFEASYAKWIDYHERMGWQYAPTLAAFLHDRTYEHEPPQLTQAPRRESAADEAFRKATEKLEREGE